MEFPLCGNYGLYISLELMVLRETVRQALFLLTGKGGKKKGHSLLSRPIICICNDQ